MKRIIVSLSTIIMIAALVSGCALFGSTASLSFALTDAPVDSATITAVKATVSSVAVNESTSAVDTDTSWKIVTISPPIVLDLLTLRNGVTAALGTALDIKGGTQINQIRLGVDSVVIVDNGVELTADIPSRTGLKIVNAFQVPMSGAITLTIDFDARKSIVAQGNAQGYIVKPVLRAVIEGEAGKITGTGPAGTATVYAYPAGTVLTDAEKVANTDGIAFANAYNSSKATDALAFTLAFMDAGSYDLYAVSAAGAIVGSKTAVAVTAGATTSAVAIDALAQ